MLREALVEALDEHHLLHAKGERPGFFTRMLAELYAQTRFSLALPDVNGFVQVTVHPLGSAILRFTRRRAIPDYRGLIASLERSLLTRPFDGGRCIGLFMLVVALTMMGLSIWFRLT